MQGINLNNNIMSFIPSEAINQGAPVAYGSATNTVKQATLTKGHSDAIGIAYEEATTSTVTNETPIDVVMFANNCTAEAYLTETGTLTYQLQVGTNGFENLSTSTVSAGNTYEYFQMCNEVIDSYVGKTGVAGYRVEILMQPKIATK